MCGVVDEIEIGVGIVRQPNASSKSWHENMGSQRSGTLESMRKKAPVGNGDMIRCRVFEAVMD